MIFNINSTRGHTGSLLVSHIGDATTIMRTILRCEIDSIVLCEPYSVSMHVSRTVIHHDW